MEITSFYQNLVCIKCTIKTIICYNICIVHTWRCCFRKGRYIFMTIEDYKTKIHTMVDEIMELGFIVQIYTVTIILYRKFKGGE